MLRAACRAADLAGCPLTVVAAAATGSRSGSLVVHCLRGCWKGLAWGQRESTEQRGMVRKSAYRGGLVVRSGGWCRGMLTSSLRVGKKVQAKTG